MIIFPPAVLLSFLMTRENIIYPLALIRDCTDVVPGLSTVSLSPAALVPPIFFAGLRLMQIGVIRLGGCPRDHHRCVVLFGVVCVGGFWGSLFWG
jgi:hypothetical protein